LTDRACPDASQFHRNGKPIRSFWGAWQTACRLAGCPGRILHDFRRTAVRNLVRAGVPDSIAMKMTGHKTRAVFDRYDIVSETDLTEASRKLNALAGTIAGTIRLIGPPTGLPLAVNADRLNRLPGKGLKVCRRRESNPHSPLSERDLELYAPSRNVSVFADFLEKTRSHVGPSRTK